MQQAIVNASPICFTSYSSPPSGHVLQFECLLPSYHHADDDDYEFCPDAGLPTHVNDSLDSLPDISTFEAPIFDEYINSMDSTPGLGAAMEDRAILSSVIPDNSQSFMIDLPNPDPASYSSTSVIHGEIKEMISWADPVGSTSKIGSPMEIASSPTPTVSKLCHFHINTSVRRALKTMVPPSSIGPNVEMNSSSNQVAFHVKTDALNLYDGYVWRKYGEKCLKNHKFTRSYFRCAQYGCGVMKRTERCSMRQEYVVFTYVGRHNHHHP